jgi:hypothetical protein
MPGVVLSRSARPQARATAFERTAAAPRSAFRETDKLDETPNSPSAIRPIGRLAPPPEIEDEAHACCAGKARAAIVEER